MVAGAWVVTGVAVVAASKGHVVSKANDPDAKLHTRNSPPRLETRCAQIGRKTSLSSYGDEPPRHRVATRQTTSLPAQLHCQRYQVLSLVEALHHMRVSTPQ